MNRPGGGSRRHRRPPDRRRRCGIRAALVASHQPMRTAASLTTGVVAVVMLAILGGLFGGQALARQDEMARQFDAFASAIALIEANYVDDVEVEQLVSRAVGGMLQTLDPHSSYMDARSYARLRERQEGRYYGLGISINVINGRITIQSLFEGSPAYRAGLRRGDVIARIEGDNAIGMSSDQAVGRLRGPRGTSVNISIERPGYDDLIDLAVERDEINIATVEAAFMVDDVTAYVRLGDFAETSNEELTRALASLRAEGFARLMLDLRGNPGGPLDQAIEVSNQFLPNGDMIVYTRGRVANSDQDYFAREAGEYTDQPLIVLVNRNSASASEIVAGAVQDHDRGLVVGETTFGKALVQSIFRVSHGAGLALTTARYFTPSGRMLQRPWDAAFDEYLTYSLREPEAPNRIPADRKLTDAGREVYSGGGVEPDHFLTGPIAGFDPSRFGRLLSARRDFVSFAQRFSAAGDTRVSLEGADRVVVDRGFVIDDAMLADFKAHVEERGLTVDEEAFAADLDFIRAMIHYEIDTDLFGEMEARRRLFDYDPQAQYALTLFDEAEALLLLGDAATAVAAQ
ncbi:MAG: S41 family peptidase [Acidobacteria bacterium]|nr:S41 family peptidase [Acidobacteriota bacterium]MYD71378.1 S41 family peptidase [Acidobacteriota bacterium]MYJ05436.1 S41 family peptidase [Acidobacteriota bacterium]